MDQPGKYQGLPEIEAARRLGQFGFNEIASAKPKSIARIVLEVIREPMFILLISCGSLYLVLGDTGEGIMLMSSVVIVLWITLYQQRRTERALDALKELSSPRALVIRDGVEKRIAGRELVTDDIIVLQEGDRVPADAVLKESLSLKIDESLLTGESEPVRKLPGGKEDEGNIFSGTLVVRGHGVAQVVATGQQTRFGKIGTLLKSVEEEETLLRKETRKIVRIFSALGFGICMLLLLVFGILQKDWLHGLLAGLSLGMAMLPEEFPVVLTIFMALGAWRMSAKKVLTRHGGSIETLGAVTVLCSDKTGTLTQNRMTVRKLYTGGRTLEVTDRSGETLPEDFHPLVEYAILASQRNPFDPMEQAFLRLGELRLEAEHLHGDWIMEREYPLSPSLFALSHVYRKPGEKTHVIASKGSPEAIAELCHMDHPAMLKLQHEIEVLAEEGLRVLGVARAIFQAGDLPGDQHAFDFEFVGLIGMEDPLRESIRDDIATCYAAGVRVIMITGDYAITAQHIAEKMGLHNPKAAITGKDLSLMSDLELAHKIKTNNIFARVSPEQKLRIVNALKANGEIVAMTGDGVNDAPSLKAAHIGVAMGQRGTDVAREASALVLLDDNFTSITQAIRMGRRIYDNMKNAMGYIFSVHIPIAGLTLIPAWFTNYPMVMLPLHIAFLELIIDPACSLIFEAEEEEKDIMSRPPRKATKPVFGPRRILICSLQGLGVLSMSLLVYFIALRLGRPHDEVRALTFTTLVISNIGLILINRSWTRTAWETLRINNPAVRWVVISVGFFLAICLYLPGLRHLFHFDVLHADDLLICLVAGIVSVIWFEVVKIFHRRTAHPGASPS